MTSTTTSTLLHALFVAACFLTSSVDAHGYLKSPRSRNWYAAPASGSKNYGTPPAEYCPHCLNRKNANEVCGRGQAQSYDNWRDTNGNPMQWTNQGTYSEGQEIVIESVITAHHWGHIEVRACPHGNSSTQSCFNAHPLTFVEDMSYGAPYDPSYPERGYIAPPTGGTMEFRFKFRLPAGVSGNNVLLQWKYITANDCYPPGYRQALGGRGWLAANGRLGDCNSSQWPPDETGARRPEQFWSCADIVIGGGGGPSNPRPSPPSNPRPSPPVTSPSGGCCSWNGGQSCGGGPWCAASRSNCEGGCSGQWVRRRPAPTPPSGGCCSWNGGQSCGGGPWCAASRSNCEGGCSGQWVRKGGPAPPPPARGCCSWNGGHSCGGGPWCNASRGNCVNGCSGQWV